MGRKNRFGGKPRDRDAGGRSTGWAEIEKRNEKFEEYYKAQGIVPEDEWDKFYEACKAPLPVTFRITGSRVQAEEVRAALINEYVPMLKGIVWDGEEVEPPSQLPWYPKGLGWQIRVGKTVIRKSKPFSRFQKFLVVETDVGNISRQEAVSMIPPLLLDVQPHHKVIDLCAAPGSKTAQLIEAVHAEPNPSGLVIANDNDYKRSHMLIHQVKRLNSPNLLVTNHDAQLFPRIKVVEHAPTAEASYLKFDRVLCDVPCSGDGTMRKNINVWRDWTVQNGIGLHQIQLNILNRGLNLLAPGGRLVYSTCSLNPIENEAVVAEALRQWKGKASLVDCSGEMTELVRRPGMTSWKVMGKDKVWHTEPTDTIPASCFAKDDLAELNIDRCMRVYPHDQDTGGFFITVFEKAGAPEPIVAAAREPVVAAAAELAAEPATEADEASNKRAAEDDESEAKRQKLETDTAPDAAAAPVDTPVPAAKPAKLPRDANEEPFKFIKLNHKSLDICWEFYGIKDEFKRASLLVRNSAAEPLRTIYYVHPTLRPVIELNESKVRFIHAGVKMFAFQKTSAEGQCAWRVQSEGLEYLIEHISSKRVVHSDSLDLFKRLCETSFSRLNEYVEVDKSFVEQTEKLEEGCAFLSFTRNGVTTVYPMWKGKGSINLMLSKQDTAELLHRIFKIETVPAPSTTSTPVETSAEATPEVGTAEATPVSETPAPVAVAEEPVAVAETA
ncbi:S-adenosyl-L-methionine-dependent methyltransferase [Dipodascopsis tothii]|uniref:S-adenosyl-L-methionine-dependent methyltransferase n=1 Tax=Dipodascopsis tothii TaxID=44089 RepID=UPI0034CE32C9